MDTKKSVVDAERRCSVRITGDSYKAGRTLPAGSPVLELETPPGRAA
jgi:hypothetical protein